MLTLVLVTADGAKAQLTVPVPPPRTFPSKTTFPGKSTFPGSK